MQRRISEVKIVMGLYIEAQKEINELIKQGWQPDGHTAYTGSSSVLQRMVKYDEQIKNDTIMEERQAESNTDPFDVETPQRYRTKVDKGRLRKAPSILHETSHERRYSNIKIHDAMHDL